MHQKKDTHIGHRSATWQDSVAAQSGPVTRGRTKRDGIPIPSPDERWLPLAQSWFNSLKLSGQSDFYEASDWATAVAAASAYDIFMRTQNASIFSQFVKLSERLGATIVDRRHARIELNSPNERRDHDEDAADNVVHGWQERLNARKDSQK